VPASPLSKSCGLPSRRVAGVISRQGAKPPRKKRHPRVDSAWFKDRTSQVTKQGGWGRVGFSQRAPGARASEPGASPFRARPEPPTSCDPRSNHAVDLTSRWTQSTRVIERTTRKRLNRIVLLCGFAALREHFGCKPGGPMYYGRRNHLTSAPFPQSSDREGTSIECKISRFLTLASIPPA